MRAHESFTFGPAATGVSSTSSQFQLLGGKYWFSAVGTFNGATVALQRLQGDGELLTVGSVASVTANGGGVVDLPPGTYQVTISSSTTAVIYSEVVRIPEE